MIFVFNVVVVMTFINAYDYDCNQDRHQYDVTIIKTATLHEDGLREYECALCGHSFTEPISSNGHVWGPWIIDVLPSCMTSGHKYRACNNIPGSSHIQEETIPATGHNFGEFITDIPAEAGKEGHKYKVCANDPSHIIEEIIPALPLPQVTPGPATSAPTPTVPPATSSQSTQTALPPTPTQPAPTIHNTAAPAATTEFLGDCNKKNDGLTDDVNGMDVALGALFISIIGVSCLLLRHDNAVLKWNKGKQKEALLKAGRENNDDT